MKPEALSENPVAQLRYAALLPVAQAESIITAQATDGRWRKNPEEWLDACRRLASRKGEAPKGRLGSFSRLAAESIMEGDLADGFTNALLETFGSLLLYGDTETVEAMVAWFVGKATAGHAPMCAAVLSSASVFAYGDSSAASRLPASMFPMVEWLLKTGTAELRATLPGMGHAETNKPDKHGGLLPRLVKAVCERERPDLLEVALRYVVLARVKDCGWSWQKEHGLWPQVERALEYGASKNIAIDILERIGFATAPSREQIWAPFLEGIEYPRTRTALLEGLCDGNLSKGLAVNTWKFAFCGPPPSKPHGFANQEVLRDAVEQLGFALAGAFDGYGLHIARTDLAGWAAYLFDEYVRLVGLGGLVGFERVVGWEKQVTRAVEQQLNRVLLESERPASVVLARGIMKTKRRKGVSRGLRLKAAFAALASEASQSTPSVSLDLLEETLVRLLDHPWTDDRYGVRMRELLGGRRAVAFEELPDSAKVHLDHGRVVLAPGYYQNTLSGESERKEDAIRLCVLYFLHELIHLQQGIGEYETVKTVRSTGAEMTLMHLDLAADHAACMLAATAFPEWGVLELKDLSGRSLSAFPASTFHTQSARYRKAARLVSVRLDWLARKHRRVPEKVLGDGYVFADYGPGGGELLMLCSGPPFSLVDTMPLRAAEASVLWNAADSSASIVEVDAVLVRGLEKGVEREG